MTSTGVLLYGPPASGKDTVTNALAAESPLFELFRRLKVGVGRTQGYRMATDSEIAALESRGHVLYENRRYGARYVIDRPELDRLISRGRVPVVHLGQPEAIEQLIAATPSMQWLTVQLWCPRETAAARIAARQTGDTTARLRAWAETPKLAQPDIHIDTAITAPEEAARRIALAVESSWAVVVPALNPVDQTGAVDLAAVRVYASKTAKTWVDRVLLNGSTTRGDLLTPTERAEVLDQWLDGVSEDRLLACVWTPEDLAVARQRGITPMVVLRGLTTPDSATAFLSRLPPHATIYSHPMFGATFGPDLAERALARGHLPAGGKLAKVTPAELSQIRQVAPGFAAWDGSSRRLRVSLSAGAAGVVATPLTALIAGALPPKLVSPLQAAIDPIQEALDQLPDRPSRRSYLLECLTQALRG